ncbi:MAG: EAL domain-containing protein [Negativicutes bacterium]|nr:EAL domain-containing protein [Negativicutes bacterium]
MRTESYRQTSLDAILEKRAIETHFQPVVSMRKKSVIGVEALSRGLDPLTAAVIMPQVLFSLAAASGRVVDLDRLCREKALENFKHIRTTEDSLLLFLNLDASIIDKGVVGSGHLIQSVEKMGLSPSSVVIEIIESRVDDIQALKTFIAAYRKYGFLIALDDIGNGHSNLDRIFHVRPDIIKIDRCLVAEIDKDYYKQEVFKSLVGLAKKIGSLVVVEGVETKEEALACLEFGADMLQGYYFAKPQPLPNVLQKGIGEKINLIVADYMNARIEHINAKLVKKQRYDNVLESVVRELSKLQPAHLEMKLRELAEEHDCLQSFYILDMAGLQITDTIETPSETDEKRHGIFQAAFNGVDQSLKDYYVFICAGLDRHITEVYRSLANGKLCVTGSIVFKDCTDNRYILCVDFNP